MSMWRPGAVSTTIVNERVKALASLLFNLGAALAAATAVKVYTDAAVDGATIVWSFMTAVLIYARWLMLSLIETEGGYDNVDVR